MKKFTSSFCVLIVLFFYFIISSDAFSQGCYSPVIDSIISRVTEESVVNYVRELSGEVPCIIGGNTYTLHTRAYNQPGNDLAAQYIYEHLQSYGMNPVYWQFSTTGKNVIGKKTGTKYPNQKYIICAHYDSYPFASYAPGADDNATGIAGVLEAAKQLSTYNTDYTLLFIGFDEEEIGLFGSEAYADSAFVHGDSIVGVINLDMIAYDPSSANNVSVITNPASLNFANVISGSIKTYMPIMNVAVNNSSMGSSDHYSFWARGFAAAWPFENPSNPHVNSTGDTIEFFNFTYFKNMARSAVAAFAMLGFDYKMNFYHDPVPSTNDSGDRIATIVIRSSRTLAAGSNSPKLYYKVGSGAFQTLSSFYNNLDTFKFSIPGQTQGHTISYYFAAQDANGEMVATYPAGGRGFNPPGTVPPSSFFTYCITTTFFTGSNTVPKTILPLQTTYDTIHVSQTGAILNFDLNLTINFPNDQNLLLMVTRPGYPQIQLSTNNGGSGANYTNTTFDDEASIPITQGQPPFTGHYRPQEQMHKYANTVSQGDWILKIFNTSSTLSGQLTDWGLYLDYFNPIGIANNQVPMRTDLSQNYPNPFNPSTKIDFSLDKQFTVKLIVYDILGREVREILNSKLNSGDYSIAFNGDGLPSGIYFYTLYLDGSRYGTKKMMLIK